MERHALAVEAEGTGDRSGPLLLPIHLANSHGTYFQCLATHLVHMDRVGTGQNIKPEGEAWGPRVVIFHRLEKRIQTKTMCDFLGNLDS